MEQANDERRRRGRGVRRTLGCLLIMVLLGTIGLQTANTAKARPDSPLKKGDFAGHVGIGNGRFIYLECHGRGSPTVLLEAGLRSRSDFWSVRLDQSTPTPTTLPGVARITRVCVYDRPGTTLGADKFSRSSPVPMPRTAGAAAKDLNTLIRTARIRGPYVLAGHSTGGLIQRLYASRHRRHVAGVVQVDALSEFIQPRLTVEQFNAFDELNNGPIPGIDYPDLESIGFRPSFRQMRRAKARHPLRGVPVTVIARGEPQQYPDDLPGGLTPGLLERVWQASQRKLAKLTGRTRFVVAKRSSHYVMFSQPGLIIREIRRVVHEVRETR